MIAQMTRNTGQELTEPKDSNTPDIYDDLDILISSLNRARGLLNCFISYADLDATKERNSLEYYNDSQVLRNSKELFYAILDSIDDSIETVNNTFERIRRAR